MINLKTDNLFSRGSRLVSRAVRHSVVDSRQLASHHLSPFTFHLSPSRKGFTLIEILVASLLLGMLMTILTMVFNSSAIAWRTGRASNAKMSLARRQLSYAQYLADNALPRIDQNSPSVTGRILGAWDKKGEVRRRAVEVFPSGKFPFSLPSWGSQGSAGTSVPEPWAKVNNIQKLQTQSGQGFLVGVRSWGPDGKEDTLDDIDTMPVTVE